MVITYGRYEGDDYSLGRGYDSGGEYKEDYADEHKEGGINKVELNAAELAELDAPIAFTNISTLIGTLDLHNDNLAALPVTLNLEELQQAD